MQGFPSQKNQLLKKGNNGRPLTLKIDICKYPDSYPEIDTLCTKIERKISEFIKSQVYVYEIQSPRFAYTDDTIGQSSHAKISNGYLFGSGIFPNVMLDLINIFPGLAHST